MFKKISFILIALILFTITLFIGADVGFTQEIKIVQFSDVHLDTKNNDKPVRKFAQSLPMFQRAIKKVNVLNPDIVVFSGDMVNKPDENEFDIFLKNAKDLNMEFYPVVGNHDVGVNGGLTKQKIIEKINKNCAWLNLTSTSYFIIKGEYLIIFMDGTNDKQITSKGTFSKDTLQFLDRTLTLYPYKKVIIVQHFPLLPPFKSPSHEITNRNEYFDVLDRHNNVIIVLSGHYHASHAAQRNNVLYITTPSMIEYPHAFRYLTVDSDKKSVIIKSQLVVDIDQNDKEDTTNAIARLKLGLPSDNDFTVKLKNTVPQEPLFDFAKGIFVKK
ncbi:MAG: metallophosphoesterase [Candidatus Gastranaerophilales bacterium]|nr:metallophosphoesterase [Candidatus Gastranaerophilales bacterium]